MYGSCKRGRVILVVRDAAKKDLTNEKTIIYPFNFKLDGNSKNVEL